MKTLWKQLAQPHVDYCSQLFMPVNGSNLTDLENLQRSFTNRIPEVKHLGYWERLKKLQMLSQQRRLERYRVIYLWKIMEGKSPNCGIQNSIKSERLGRTCPLPEVKKSSSQRIQTLRENSFQIHAPKLFNSLPKEIRNLTGCSVDKFKEALTSSLKVYLMNLQLLELTTLLELVIFLQLNLLIPLLTG